MILVLQNVLLPALRIETAGIRRFASLRGWKVKFARLRSGEGASRIREIVGTCRPDGIIASLNIPLPADVVGRVPVVCFDCRPNVVPDGVPYICHDALATAHLAAQELFKRRCAAYSFMRASGNWFWSTEREKAFADEVRFRGGRMQNPFSPPPAETSSPGIGGGSEFGRALCEWVGSLEKPCGVFAANDALASLLLKACRKCGVAVPKDVMVVGVDNDLSICLKLQPKLTSVVPDWEMGAFMAAETLDKAMRGAKASTRLTFRPLGMVGRESTQEPSGRTNFRVEKAVELIRNKSCSGLSAAKVVISMGCSRRLAEMRFREVTGASIQEAIRHTRLQNAHVMLETTSLSISEVARRSGWSNLALFSRNFKLATDVSPSEWRRRATVS